MNKVLTITAFLFLILVKNSFSQTTEWIMIWDDETNSRYYFYDPSTIKLAEEYLDVELKIVPYSDEIPSDANVDYIIDNVRLYCTENMARSNKSVVYYVDGTAVSIDKTEKHTLERGSPLEIFYRILCSK